MALTSKRALISLSAILLSGVSGQDETFLLQQQRSSLTFKESLGSFGYKGCYRYGGRWNYVSGWRSGTDRYHCKIDLLASGSSWVQSVGQLCKDMGGTRLMINRHNGNAAAGSGYNHCCCFTDDMDNDVTPIAASDCSNPCDGAGATNGEMCGNGGYRWAVYDLNQAGTPSGAQASGDPHATNLRNEEFEIHTVGQLNMITMPRGSDAEGAELAIYATTTANRWSTCAPSFISEVKIYTQHACEEITVRPGQNVPDTQTVVKQESCTLSVITSKENMTEVVIPMNDVTVHDVTVRVSQKLIRLVDGAENPMATTFAYLDLEVVGFHDATNIGGILGWDKYTEATPSACNGSTALHSEHSLRRGSWAVAKQV